MRILALQLKRIGDLVLTTPALRALSLAWPEANMTLGLMDGTAGLVEAIPFIDGGIVFGRGRGWTPWQQVLTGGWDMCFDFTGNDRSALATVFSLAKDRVGFEWIKRHRLRALAYNTWSPSKVRDVHTAQHYLDLVSSAVSGVVDDPQPELRFVNPSDIPAMAEPYALLHPGTARADKYWLPERWSELAAHLHSAHSLKTVFTCGPDEFERSHLGQISEANRPPLSEVRHPKDLISLAHLVANARIVISCDTGVVHLAAAFRKPQVTLYGPINPFQWRPLHDRAVVISAAHPGAPLTEFTPRMKGAPMDQISTAVVIRATDSLLAPSGVS